MNFLSKQLKATLVWAYAPKCNCVICIFPNKTSCLEINLFLFGVDNDHLPWHEISSCAYESCSCSLTLHTHPNLVLSWPHPQVAWAFLGLSPRSRWNSPLSSASKWGGQLPPGFLHKVLFASFPHRSQTPATAPWFWIHSLWCLTQGFSSTNCFDLIFVFWSTKIFILFLRLVLSSYFLFKLTISILAMRRTEVWIPGYLDWNVLPMTPYWSLNYLGLLLSSSLWIILPRSQETSQIPLQISISFLVPLLFTSSLLLFSCNVFFLWDLTSPLLFISSYTCYLLSLYLHPRFPPQWDPDISALWPRCSIQLSILVSSVTLSP